MSEIKYRWAPSLGGGFDGTAKTAWGIEEWDGEEDCPVVFCGLYGLPDFYTLWRHKNKKYVWWAGSDIIHFSNGYWLDDTGNIRVDARPLGDWLEKECEHWVENEAQKEALSAFGITANVAPSFLGNVEDYEVSYVPSERPQVYLSSSEGWEVMYGWGIVENIAQRCDVDFHLYGSPLWETKHSNVFVHGRVPKEQMNEEIKGMQCGLRLNEGTDGFSEITAKSVLWGQYPIVGESYSYPHLTSFRSLDNLVFQLNRLKHKKNSNPARDWYISNLNKYPWNQKIK